MTETNRQECRNCRYWRDLHDAWAGKGECRRYPPEPAYSDRNGDQAWPQTTGEKWCGEFAANQSGKHHE